MLLLYGTHKRNQFFVSIDFTDMVDIPGHLLNRRNQTLSQDVGYYDTDEKQYYRDHSDIRKRIKKYMIYTATFLCNPDDSSIIQPDCIIKRIGIQSF